MAGDVHWDDIFACERKGEERGEGEEVVMVAVVRTARGVDVRSMENAAGGQRTWRRRTSAQTTPRFWTRTLGGERDWSGWAGWERSWR